MLRVGLGISIPAFLAAASGIAAAAFSADFTKGTLPSQISFSRASNAMQYDSAGKLTYAPNNLLLYSNDFTNAAWAGSNFTKTAGVADPFGGTSATTLTDTAGGGYINAGGATNAATCIGSVWLRRRTGTGTVRMWNPGAVNQDITTSLTSSWQRFGFVSAPTPGVAYIQVQTLTAGDAIDIYGAQLEAVTYETSPRTYNPTTSSVYYGPRFDYDPNGPIDYAPNNLITNSNTFSSWTIDGGGGSVTTGASDPLGGTGASTFTASGVNARIYSQFHVGTASAFQAINSIWIRRRTGTGTITYWDPLNTPHDITSQVTGTWSQVYFKAVNGVDIYNLLVLATSGDAIDLFHAQSEAVTYETAPRAYLATTTSIIAAVPIYTAKGLLVEEQRTNLFLSSNNFLDNVNWLNNNSTRSATTDILGGSTGAVITATTSTNSHVLQQNVSVSNATRYTMRLFLKAGTAPYTVFGEEGGANWKWGSIKWSDHSVTTNGQGSATVQAKDVGNGVWQVDYSWVTEATTAQIWVGPSPASAATIGNASGAYAGAGTETSLILGAQMELGAFATSYIPTTSAAVTRSADFNSIVGADFTNIYNQSANTFVLEYQGEETPDPNGDILSINNGTFQETNTIYADLAIFFRAGNVNQLTPGPGLSNPLTPGSPHRVAVAASVADGYAICCDGATGNTGFNTATVGAMPTPDRIEFGGNSRVSGNKPSGWYRSLAIYKSRLSDATLQALTSFDPVFTADFTAGTLPAQVSFARATTGTYYNSAGVLSTAAIDAPRFDYDPVTHAAKGLLIEEQRTNEALYSNTFDNAAWAGFGKTVTAAAGASPDGTTDAYRLQLDANSQGNSYLQQVIAGAAGDSQTHTFSIWARTTSGTQAFAIKATQGAVADHFSADLTATTTWQRFTFSQAFAAGGSAPIVGITTPIGGTAVDIQIFGAQFERNASFPTSYIPTTSAAVTRSADIAQLAGSALTAVQGGFGTQVSEIDSVDPGSPNILSGLPMQLATGTAPTIWQTFPGSSLTIIGANDRTLGPVRAATSWGSNGASLYATGAAAVATGTVPEPAHTGSPWYLGCRNDGAGNFLNGHFRKFALYNTRLPDSRLQRKSIVGASFNG
jgi:hypothetical protein